MCVCVYGMGRSPPSGQSLLVELWVYASVSQSPVPSFLPSGPSSLLCKMGLPVPAVSPAFWVLGCFFLFLWLWVLCTACHRKQAERQYTGLQGSMMPVEVQV